MMRGEIQVTILLSSEHRKHVSPNTQLGIIGISEVESSSSRTAESRMAWEAMELSEQFRQIHVMHAAHSSHSSHSTHTVFVFAIVVTGTFGRVREDRVGFRCKLELLFVASLCDEWEKESKNRTHQVFGTSTPSGWPSKTSITYLVWVVYQALSSVRFLNLTFRGIFGDTQNLVVIFCLASLQRQLCFL